MGGEEAIAFLKADPSIDILLIDLRMPKLDGIDTLKRIRCFNQHVRVYAQTAYHLKADQIEMLKSVGFQNYILKPLTTELIEQLVKESN